MKKNVHPYPNKAAENALKRAVKIITAAIELDEPHLKDAQFVKQLPGLIRGLYTCFDWNTNPPTKWDSSWYPKKSNDAKKHS